MNVLSLFDGMSCGMAALKKTNLKVDNYYSSEIDKYAIGVSKENYPNIIRLGDIKKWKDWDLPKIDLMIGGSPCQGFSINGKKLNFEDDRSKLFFEFLSLLEIIKPKYWLLENVATMDNEIKKRIDELIGVEGVFINSNAKSAQNRKRYYWTNIDFKKNLEVCSLKIKDVLEENENFILMKEEKIVKQVFNSSETDGVITLNPKRINGKQTYQQDRIYDCEGRMPALTATLGNRFYIKDKNSLIRKLTIREQARLQNIPDDFTFGSCSDLQASKMLGNGWTVDVIVHILNGIKISQGD